MPAPGTIDAGNSVQTNQSSAHAVVPVTLGAALAAGPCRGFVCGTAGTLNFTDGSGVVRTNFPAQQGFNPVEAQFFATGGTASDLWAVY